MKKKTIILLAILFVNIASFSQQITNGNFETWVDENNADVWNSVNLSFFSSEFHSAIRSTDVHLGTYAAELTSGEFLSQFIPGLVTLGQIDEANQTITGGIPFSDRPTGISYFFKYLPQGNDTSYMIALLTKWNTTTQEADTVGMTGYFTADTYNNYTELNVPFFYNSTESPDTLNVIFLSSGFAGTVGSSLLVDDVTLLYGAVISPTICFPASNITNSQFTTRCLKIPTASSYKLDVSESDNFSTFISGYEDLDIGNDTFAIVDVPTGLYFYRKRVNYGTETSINSNTIAVAMPTLNFDATDVLASSFTANWQIVNNATNYYIDIATDVNFQNFVTGYEDIQVSGTLSSLLIENLDAETQYFYRLRVEYQNGDYLSNNSNVISVNTAVGVNDVISEKVNVYSFNNKISVNFNSKVLPNCLSLYDMNGRLIKKISNLENKISILVEDAGVYIVKLNYDSFVVNKKVVIW